MLSLRQTLPRATVSGRRPRVLSRMSPPVRASRGARPYIIGLSASRDDASGIFILSLYHCFYCHFSITHIRLALIFRYYFVITGTNKYAEHARRATPIMPGYARSRIKRF